jgi:hypothetical protein
VCLASGLSHDAQCVVVCHKALDQPNCLPGCPKCDGPVKCRRCGDVEKADPGRFLAEFDAPRRALASAQWRKEQEDMRSSRFAKLVAERAAADAAARLASERDAAEAAQRAASAAALAATSARLAAPAPRRPRRAAA